jgi:hypothetical protein
MHVRPFLIAFWSADFRCAFVVDRGRWSARFEQAPAVVGTRAVQPFDGFRPVSGNP